MHIRQLKSGSWRVIVQVDSRRMSATAPTRAEAERAGAQLVLDAGGTPSGTNTTVGELLDLHLAEHDYRPTTLADLKRVRDALPAQFLARKVGEVEPVVIDGLYRQLTKSGWSPHRVQRIHGLLGSAFQRAKRRGWARTVPTRDADLPKIPEREDTTPDVAAVRRLLAAADDDFRLFLWLAATTGARRGELCALQWADVDTKAAVLRIRRAVSYTKASGLVIGETKTGVKGRRGIPLEADTLEMLDRHLLAQRKAGLAAGITDVPWIFTSNLVRCWRPEFPTYRFMALRDSLGLDTVRLHDIRHFVASELVGGITDARTAADHLGHARTSMTLDRYSAPLEQRRRDAAVELGRRLRG